MVQEPLLYRCSLTARIAQCYQTLHSKTPFRTLLHVLAPRMDFSVTSGQVPLLYRLHFLLRDLISGDLGPPRGETVGRPSGGEADTEAAARERDTTEEAAGASSLG